MTPKRMSIYLTGDTHGGIERFRDHKGFNKDDTVIVLGDFGVIWHNLANVYGYVMTERPKIEELDRYGCTFCFIDGNHENHERLAALPDAPLFGGIAGQAGEHVFHLRRGQVYEIEGKSFFCMGGALSIDRAVRTEGESWWPGENITTDDMRRGVEALEKRGNKVDYVLTHTPPERVLRRLLDVDSGHAKLKDPNARLLDQFYETVKFKKWFFGHMHFDAAVIGEPNFVGLFRQIIRLGNARELKNMLHIRKMSFY